MAGHADNDAEATAPAWIDELEPHTLVGTRGVLLPKLIPGGIRLHDAEMLTGAVA